MGAPKASSTDEVVAILRESWNCHDMAAYAAQFAADAVYINAIGAEWRGREEIEQCHRRLHATVFRDSRITGMTQRIVTLAPGIAVCVSHWEMVGAKPPQDWKMGDPRQGVLTLVLVKGEDSWQIAAAQNTDKQAIELPGE